MAVPKEYSLLRAACIYLELCADIFSANVAGTCSEVTVVTEPSKCLIYLHVHLNFFYATFFGTIFDMVGSPYRRNIIEYTVNVLFTIWKLSWLLQCHHSIARVYLFHSQISRLEKQDGIFKSTIYAKTFDDEQNKRIDGRPVPKTDGEVDNLIDTEESNNTIGIRDSTKKSLSWYFIHVYVINRILHARFWIRILYSSLQVDVSFVRCAHSWDRLEHLKINFVSTRGHVLLTVNRVSKNKPLIVIG